MLSKFIDQGSTPKKIWLARTMLLLVLLLSVALPAMAADYVTSNGHVYLRKGAGTDTDIVLVLQPNSRLKVIGTSGDWYEVEYGRKTGYVRNDVVTAEGASTSSASNVTATNSTSTTTAYATLKQGDSGDAVYKLQEALIYSGFLDTMPDGKYGEDTTAAVKVYQEENGLTADGVAGAKTQAMIFAESRYLTATGQTAATVTATSSATDTTTQYTTLRYGDSNDNVRTMQNRLTELGYFEGASTGNFRSTTRTAVKYFQEKNGLTADGIAGKKTLEILYSASAVAKNPDQVVTAGDGSSVNAVVYSDESLRLGSAGDAVKSLQTRLIELGYLSGRADGTFGAKTETAVIAFQAGNKLTADGVAGKKTQNAIYASTAVAASSTTVTATNSSSLKRDSKGDDVKKLQTQLTALKYYTGSITGNFGSLTEKAVMEFQKRNGLTADGVAGSTTLTKLYGSNAVANSGSSSGSSSSNGTTVSSSGSAPSAASVKNVNWYSGIRTQYKAGTIVTIYDFETGLSWKCRFMSNGKHADSEPLTSQDTEIMYRAFGNKNTWTPKAVWVTMPDGNTFIASMHNVEHLSGSIKDNNFDGHLCIHFPRTMSEAEETGPYAVSHQKAIQKGWEKTQQLAGR